MLTLTKESTVAEIVAHNIRTANIFKMNGIDFCCGGAVSLEKICHKNEISFEILRDQLMGVDKLTARSENYDRWDLGFLIDHIVNIHHSYVNDRTDLIHQYLNKVVKAHGHHYKELHEIKALFQKVAEELLFHMQKEEQILFPFIKELLKTRQRGSSFEPPHFCSVNNPIRMMETEHENAGAMFKKIAQLTNQYSPPNETCNTFKALYETLKEFEEDLHLHIHLENNILHPKAKKLEAQLK